jgi:hypothetical protein
MDRGELQPQTTQPPRCAACGEVLGVYEPVVRVVEDRVYPVSRATGSGPLTPDAGDFYHAGCSPIGD